MRATPHAQLPFEITDETGVKQADRCPGASILRLTVQGRSTGWRNPDMELRDERARVMFDVVCAEFERRRPRGRGPELAARDDERLRVQRGERGEDFGDAVEGAGGGGGERDEVRLLVLDERHDVSGG